MLGVAVTFLALIGVSLSVDVCDKGLIGKPCGSDKDCPQCLKCCEGTGKCHERTPYSGDYVVPLADANDPWSVAHVNSVPEGEAYCMGRYGTFLPTLITQEDEDNFIATMKAADQASQNCDGCGWGVSFIGLTDRDNEGVFEWSDGTPCKIQTDLCVDFWAPGEPNLNGNNEDDCVFYFWDTTEASIDYNCGTGAALACNAPADGTDNGHDAGVAAMNASPAKTINKNKLGILGTDNNELSTHLKPSKKYVSNYNAYYELIFGGFILFVLLNNIFVCYWCVCQNNGKKLYDNVKVEFNEE